MNPYICTYIGNKLHLRNPATDEIDIRDIATGLSRQYRFNGHTQTIRPYTVAQHSVLVSYLVPEEHALQALLHDATEAYIGDMPYPAKQLCPDFQQLEDSLNAAIMARFGLPAAHHPSIKTADLQALAIERQALMPQSHGQHWPILDGVEPPEGMTISNIWTDRLAALEFKARFNEITTGVTINE